jgi:23S rRNA (guanosine2251-2'-O)-methyltransferase
MDTKNITIAVILDNIRSVHNVGSIFRTADAAGVEKVYCCGVTPAPLDRFKKPRADFAKVALGAEGFVAWESVKNTADAIESLRQEGWIIFAVEQSKHSIPYFEAWARLKKNGTQKIVLVVGNEVDGLPPEILALVDKILEIPMRGKKESLNVAVAFGVVVFGLLEN